MTTLRRGGTDAIPLRRIVGVSLNAAIDKTASVPRLIHGQIHRPHVRSVVPGGKAVNVVRAARHLGLRGEVVAVLGGHAGAWYRAALRALAIPLHAVDVPGETRTCLSVLDEGDGTLTEFYEAGVELVPSGWRRVEEALADAIGDGGAEVVVVVCGSLPPGAPADAYERLTRVAGARGSRAVVDVAGEPLAAALAARPWLVKVNAHEAATITGVEVTSGSDARTAAIGLRDRGAYNAIVTRGVEGAVLVGEEGAWTVGAVPERDRGPFSVGSGDAFLAGVLVGLSRGATWSDALLIGGAAGAASARVPGQGELDPGDVERIRAGWQVATLVE